MIRNVCIHVENEQPLLADLYDLPTSTDAGLVCTNVRTLDGKRPVFIDQAGSTFFFPYHVVRFLEIPERAMAGRRVVSSAGLPQAAGDAAGVDEPFDPEGAEQDRSLLPVAVGAGGETASDDVELEIDEGFLQRIRDI